MVLSRSRKRGGEQEKIRLERVAPQRNARLNASSPDLARMIAGRRCFLLRMGCCSARQSPIRTIFVSKLVKPEDFEATVNAASHLWSKMPRRHVPRVDDNGTDVMLAQAALELSGPDAQVSVARDGGGADALAFLRREGHYASRPTGDPHVVLLDLKMPRMGAGWRPWRNCGATCACVTSRSSCSPPRGRTGRSTAATRAGRMLTWSSQCPLTVRWRRYGP